MAGIAGLVGAAAGVTAGVVDRSRAQAAFDKALAKAGTAELSLS